MKNLLLVIEILNNPVVKEFLTQILAWIKGLADDDEDNQAHAKKGVEFLKGK